MMQIYWTLEAFADREAIFDYIEADNPVAAIALDELFEQSAKQLNLHLQSGRLGRVNGTRELVVQRNYILIYDMAGQNVRILRVLHASRQWPRI